MAAVMKEALKLDIEKEGENQELIARLYTENKVNYTPRNFKFSSNKICWSTGIKFTLVELFNKI